MALGTGVGDVVSTGAIVTLRDVAGAFEDASVLDSVPNNDGAAEEYNCCQN